MADKISVMVPYYKEEGEQVRNLLQSLPMGLLHEVAVVDDGGSGSIKEYIPQGVKYYRHTENVGPTGNYNRCIDHATGDLVHIMHADDLVQPAFYVGIANLALRWPECSFYGSQHCHIQAGGSEAFVPALQAHLCTPTTDPEGLYYGNAFAASACVIRRSFYAKHGYFNEKLVHVADWEMWIRAIRFGGGVYLPAPLITYLTSNKNHTTHLAMTADNFRDTLQLAPIFQEYAGDKFDAKIFYQTVLRATESQAQALEQVGLKDAAKHSRKLAHEIRGRLNG